jgi:hypothetical protein
MNLVDEKQAPTEESFADLVKDLRDEAIVLVRQQVELAKTEMSEKTSRVMRNAVSLVVGGLVAYTGFLYLLQFLNWGGRELLQLWGLSEGVTFWLMPLILGVVIGAIGYGLVRKGIKTIKHTDLAPQKTVHSIKEDRQWLSKKR